MNPASKNTAHVRAPLIPMALLTAMALAALIAAFIFALPAAALAVSCHCFTDREYVAEAPAKADPYLLATARNSLFAASLGQPKADVVKARMGGAEEFDLWIAHLGAAAAGSSVDNFMDAKGKEKSWLKAFSALGVAPEKLGSAFADSLKKGDSDEIAAEKLVDPYLLEGFGLTQETLTALRLKGATNAQITLAALLSNLTSADPVGSLTKVKSGQATWGMLFDNAGVSAGRVSKLIIAKMTDGLAQ